MCSAHPDCFSSTANVLGASQSTVSSNWNICPTNILWFGAAGPRLFLSCPMDVEGSRVWFTDLWNYSLVPYLLEAVREGLQVGCSKASPCEMKPLFIFSHSQQPSCKCCFSQSCIYSWQQRTFFFKDDKTTSRISQTSRKQSSQKR